MLSIYTVSIGTYHSLGSASFAGISMGSRMNYMQQGNRMQEGLILHITNHPH